MSYSANSRSDQTASQLTVNGDVLRVDICDLAAGVEYRIKVAATTSRGYGATATISAWTEIGMPPRPPRPHVNSTGPGTITVRIQPAVLTQGPLSAYFIVISTTTTTTERRRRRDAGNQRSLPDPVQHIPLPGVTVAQLRADKVNLERYFVVGDGRTYGAYVNSPLLADVLYVVHYVVASSMDGTTKMSYASTVSPVSPGTGGGSGELTTVTMQPVQHEGLGLVVIVVISVVVPLSFLILVLVIILLIYCCCCRKRPDQPEPSPAPAGSTLSASWLKYYTGIASLLHC